MFLKTISFNFTVTKKQLKPSTIRRTPNSYNCPFKPLYLSFTLTCCVRLWGLEPYVTLFPTFGTLLLSLDHFQILSTNPSIYALHVSLTSSIIDPPSMFMPIFYSTPYSCVQNNRAPTPFLMEIIFLQDK